MSTFTANPAFDGDVDRIFQASWAAARDTADGQNVDTTDADLKPRGEFNGSQYNLTRSFLSFLLSSLPSGALIQSATLSITIDTTNAIDAAHGTLHLVEGTPSSPTALEVADYNNIGATNFANTVDASTTGSKLFTFTAAGIAYLQSKLTTYATLVIRQKKDFDNTQPTGLGNPLVASVNSGTPANRPLLTIEYQTGASFINALL